MSLCCISNNTLLWYLQLFVLRVCCRRLYTKAYCKLLCFFTLIFAVFLNDFAFAYQILWANLWRHIDFSTCQPSISGFGFGNGSLLGMSKFICTPNVDEIPQSAGWAWVITTSGFWKRTAAILELYFPFRFWPFIVIRM